MTGHDCWQCRGGGHACDYGDEARDCYKRGRPVLVTYSDGERWLYFLCREHEASRILTLA